MTIVIVASQSSSVLVLAGDVLDIISGCDSCFGLFRKNMDLEFEHFCYSVAGNRLCDFFGLVKWAASYTYHTLPLIFGSSQKKLRSAAINNSDMPSL